jgi:hypothetical protein
MSQHRDNGFVRLFRQILESDLWLEPATVFKSAIAVLLLAEWRPRGGEARGRYGTPVLVPRGHLLLTRNRLARTARVSKLAAGRAIARLAALGFIGPTETDDLFSVPKYEHFNPMHGKAPRQPRRDADQKWSAQAAPEDPMRIKSDPPCGSKVIRPEDPMRIKSDPPCGSKVIRPADQKWSAQSDLSIYAVKKVKKVKKECADTSTHAPPGAPNPDDSSPEPPASEGDVANRKQGDNNGAQKVFKLTHPEAPRPRVAKRHMDAVVDAYVAAVEHRLGFAPKLGDREYKHVRDLVLRHGPEHSVELAGAYPRLDDRWLHGKGFPLANLMANANAVEVLLRGNGPKPKYDSTNVCTDPNSPGWNPDNF